MHRSLRTAFGGPPTLPPPPADPASDALRAGHVAAEERDAELRTLVAEAMHADPPSLALVQNASREAGVRIGKMYPPYAPHLEWFRRMKRTMVRVIRGMMVWKCGDTVIMVELVGNAVTFLEPVHMMYRRQQGAASQARATGGYDDGDAGDGDGDEEGGFEQHTDAEGHAVVHGPSRARSFMMTAQNAMKMRRPYRLGVQTDVLVNIIKRNKAYNPKSTILREKQGNGGDADAASSDEEDITDQGPRPIRKATFGGTIERRRLMDEPVGCAPMMAGAEDGPVDAAINDPSMRGRFIMSGGTKVYHPKRTQCTNRCVPYLKRVNQQMVAETAYYGRSCDTLDRSSCTMYATTPLWGATRKHVVPNVVVTMSLPREGEKISLYKAFLILDVNSIGDMLNCIFPHCGGEAPEGGGSGGSAGDARRPTTSLRLAVMNMLQIQRKAAGPQCRSAFQVFVGLKGFEKAHVAVERAIASIKSPALCAYKRRRKRDTLWRLMDGEFLPQDGPMRGYRRTIQCCVTRALQLGLMARTCIEVARGIRDVEGERDRHASQRLVSFDAEMGVLVANLIRDEVMKRYRKRARNVNVNGGHVDMSGIMGPYMTQQMMDAMNKGVFNVTARAQAPAERMQCFGSRADFSQQEPANILPKGAGVGPRTTTEDSFGFKHSMKTTDNENAGLKVGSTALGSCKVRDHTHWLEILTLVRPLGILDQAAMADGSKRLKNVTVRNPRYKEIRHMLLVRRGKREPRNAEEAREAREFQEARRRDDEAIAAAEEDARRQLRRQREREMLRELTRNLSKKAAAAVEILNEEAALSDEDEDVLAEAEDQNLVSMDDGDGKGPAATPAGGGGGRKRAAREGRGGRPTAAAAAAATEDAGMDRENVFETRDEEDLLNAINKVTNLSDVRGGCVNAEDGLDALYADEVRRQSNDVGWEGYDEDDFCDFDENSRCRKMERSISECIGRLRGRILLLINGRIVAPVKRGWTVLDTLTFLIRRRREGQLPPDVSVVPHELGVDMRADAGAQLIPLVRAEDADKLVQVMRPASWVAAGDRAVPLDDMTSVSDNALMAFLDTHAVEWVSSEELKNRHVRLATDPFMVADAAKAVRGGHEPPFTHIMPNAALSLFSTMMCGTFNNMTSPPRLLFLMQQIVKALSDRQYGRARTLASQNPLITTDTERVYKDFNDGSELMVASVMMDGLEDDAAILSKDAVDRGLFMAEHRMTISASDNKNARCMPRKGFSSNLKCRKEGCTDFLDEKGVIRVGTVLRPEISPIVVVERVVRMKSKVSGAPDEFQDASIVLRINGKNAQIGNVVIDQGDDGDVDGSAAEACAEAAERGRARAESKMDSECKPPRTRIVTFGTPSEDAEGNAGGAGGAGAATIPVFDSAEHMATPQRIRPWRRTNRTYEASTPKGYYQVTEVKKGEELFPSLIRVTLKYVRTVRVGDKFTVNGNKFTLHGIFNPLDAEQAFFLPDGTTPDLYINTLSTYGRRIPNELPGSIGMAVCSGAMGAQVDVTASTPVKPLLDASKEILREYTSADGREKMFPDGISSCEAINCATGLPLTTKEVDAATGKRRDVPMRVHVGMVRVSLLWQHAPEMKFSARGHVGPMTATTRQPRKGASGSIKVSEMDMDNMFIDGVAAVIEDVSSRSDMCTMPICKECGNIGQNPPLTIMHTLLATTEEERAALAELVRASFDCKVCKGVNTIVQVKIPYILVLLRNLSMIAGHVMTFKVQPVRGSLTARPNWPELIRDRDPLPRRPPPPPPPSSSSSSSPLRQRTAPPPSAVMV